MTINKFEPVQIFIYPRYLMINEPKTIVFKGNLSIKTKTIKQSLLGFEITLRILPLQIRLRCLEYNLAEEEKDKRKLFRLCCENIDSGSQINFEIINYYIHDHFILNAELESLEENEAEKPEISLNDRKQLISLIFKNTTAPTRCNFLIKIALSQNFVFTILCDVIVIPLVFSFEVYDYYTKRFTKSRFPIFFTNRKSNVLYLRIRNWSKTKKTGKIYIYKPNCISVNCTDIKLDEKFEFKENIIIPISMENKYDYIPSEKNGNVYITLYVGNKSKTIYFTFFEPLVFPNKPYFGYKYNTNENIRLNNEYLSKYPTFSIKETDKNWIQMRNNNDLINLTNDNKYFVVVTPFHYFTNDTMHKINYNYDNLSVSPNDDVSFLQLNPSKNEKNCYNFRKNTFERSYKIFYSYYYYSIYGFTGKENSTKDNWFPVFNTYPKIEGIEILPYDEINVDIAKKNIVKMFSDIGVEKINISKLIEIFGSVFNPIVEQTNFAVFMSLLLDYNIILNIISICKLMPITVQSELNLILLDIINMLGKKQSDKMYTIISHNLIVKFASIFKRRFDYLQKRNFILELPISYDEIIAKQKSIYEFDFDMAKDMSKNINAEFIAIQDQMKNIKLKELPNLNTHQECFLINEDKIDQPVPCKIIDKLGNNPFEFIENKESYSSNNMDEFTFLPPIKKSNTFSIKTLNELYSTCSQGATYLPTYVRCQRIKNASQNESEKYFGQLLDIYNETFNDQIVNKSIISTSTKYFHDSFENCIKRLKRAGISFNKITKNWL